MTHSTCDQARVEYPDLLKTAANVSTPEFDRDQYRLDEYLFDISRFPAIAEVSHFILTLSHGQANMERGFSVYKKVGQVNITKMLIVSKRLLEDYMNFKSPIPHKVPLSYE